MTGAIACGILASGCGKAGRKEAAAVFRALEIVREAPAGSKGSAAQNLAATPCSQPLVCAARDRCANVYEHFANGLAAQARVRDALDRWEKSGAAAGGLAPAQDLGGELRRAESEVNDAQAELPECEHAASAMRRAYGI